MRVVFLGTLAIAVTCLAGQVSSTAQTGAPKNAIGMEFVKIPAGEFMMGCSPDDSNCKNDENQQQPGSYHKSLRDGEIRGHPGAVEAMMRENQSSIVGDQNPVESVTRAEAIEFANRLNMLNGGYKYR